MNILYDNEVFVMQKYGGISRYYFEIIKEISKTEGVNITVYQGCNINKYNLKAFEGEKLRILGTKIPDIPRTKYLSGKIQGFLFRKFYKRTNFDIFHKTYYKPYIKKVKTKSIVTIHDFTHEKFPQYFSKLDNTTKNKKKSAEESDGIICISNSTKNDLLNTYNINENKIKVIYHGNNLDTEPVEKPIFNFPYMLYVGNRKGYKNFNNFINAYSKSSDTKKNLKIVCFGGGDITNKEKNLFRSYKIDNMIYHISGDDNILANIYKNAYVFIYPSLYEGFGIPLLEAMHYKCPVISSERSSLPEIGGDAVLYFNPENIDEIIFKIEMVLYNNELRENLIAKGLKREKEFSWNKCADETYKFYREIYGK